MNLEINVPQKGKFAAEKFAAERLTKSYPQDVFSQSLYVWNVILICAHMN